MLEMKDNHNLWYTQQCERVYPTASENMAWDQQLIKALPNNTRTLRWYTWKDPGITYSYKQECPKNMVHIDNAKRSTGGGIVFHSPGDIVFSIASWKNDPLYTGSLTQKLKTVSQYIQSVLQEKGIVLDSETTIPHINTPDTNAQEGYHERCTYYPTPFEIMHKGKKVCGLTIRRYKDKFLVQGIVHTQPSHPSFLPLLGDEPPFTDVLDVFQADFIHYCQRAVTTKEATTNPMPTQNNEG